MARFGFIRTKDEIKFLILSLHDVPSVSGDLRRNCWHLYVVWWRLRLLRAVRGVFWAAGFSARWEIDRNDTELFAITEKGRETAQAFQSRLPFTVREAAELSALRVIRKLRRDAQVSAETEQISEKDYVVTMTMQDVFSIQMHVVSQTQAAYLEQHFQKHAEDVYQHLLSTMTSEYETE